MDFTDRHGLNSRNLWQKISGFLFREASQRERRGSQRFLKFLEK